MVTAEGGPLTITGREYPLISAGAGGKILRVTIDSAGAARVKAVARACTSRCEVAPPAVATAEASAGGRAGAPADVFLKLELPHPGLYEITVTLLDKTGATLASAVARYAVVPARTTVGPPDFGVCTHFAQGEAGRDPAMIPALLDLIKLAGFSRIRDEIYWNSIEKKPGQFVFLPQHDAYLKTAHGLGLAPLVVLSFGNPQAYPEAFRGSKGFPESPAAREAYVRYAEACVKRYGQIVKQWEVWNEPQAKAFGAATKEGYAKLLIATYPRIKALAPDAQVISCGGGGAGGGPGGDYILDVIRNGGLNYQDGFSVHPYMSPHTPDRGYLADGSPIAGGRVNVPAVWTHLARFIDAHRKPDGRRLSLWVTEVGWPSLAGEPFVKSETMQAADLARLYLLARRYQTAQAVFWYDFRNDGTNARNSEHNFGLITHDYEPKPSYVAAAVLTSTLGDRPWKKTVADGDFAKVFQYGEGRDAVLAGWSVYAQDPEEVLCKPAPGRYLLRDWQGRDEEITITGDGYKWRLQALPQYLLPKH